MRVFAYIARGYNSAAESTSLFSSVASLAIKKFKFKDISCVVCMDDEIKRRHKNNIGLETRLTNSKTGDSWSYITLLSRLFNLLFANCPNWYTIYAI